MKILAWILVLSPLVASAATITINDPADETLAGNGRCTLREAVGNVNAAADLTAGDCIAGTGSGDTIVFAVTLPAVIALTSAAELAITADLSITGPGEDLLALDGNGAARVFNVAAGNLTISGLTIRNGHGSQGGGIYNAGTLKLTNCTLTANTAEAGGAIYSDGTLTLSSATLSSNIAGTGGSIYNDGDLRIARCTFIGNGAGRGGALYNEGTVTLSASVLSGNTAFDEGGGLYSNNGATATLVDSMLFANSGGGIFNNGALSLTRCTVSGNTTDSSGSGVYNDSEGAATLADCTINGNGAEREGAGVHNAGTMDIARCTLNFNTTSLGYGGAVYNEYYGEITVVDSTLSGNNGSFRGGGAVFNYGSATFVGCTLSRNAGAEGGAINNGGKALLANCTLFENSAGDEITGRGGGIDNEEGTLTLTNCTLSGNSAHEGGNVYDGTYEPGDGTTLGNTIIANNNGGNNCAGTIIDAGHNLDSDGTCNLGPATNARLDPAGVADNGGATYTIALQPDSPAINAGDNAMCAASPVNGVDQRGIARPALGTPNCSVGAYEYGPASTPTTTPTPIFASRDIEVNSVADNNIGGDGECTLREAITNANAQRDTTGGDCNTGPGGSDTIVFRLPLPATISLTTYTELSINARVTLEGPGEGLLAIDGNGAVDVFHIAAGDVTIANMTIQNGQAPRGGGIQNNATLTLTNCTLRDNWADEAGGGVYNDGTLTLTSCTLGGNRQSAAYNAGSMAMSDCTLVGNWADQGGAVFNSGTLTLTSCVLNGNTGYNAGGGLLNAGDATLTNCTLIGNSAAQGGGGLTWSPSSSGAFYAYGGGGVANIGTLTMIGSTLSGNQAARGGGVSNNGTSTMSGCALSENSAINTGGGIENGEDGTTTLTNCVLRFNSLTGFYESGAGVFNSGTMVLSDCTLFGNSAGESDGGGISNEGMVTLSNCTLANNSGTNGGGMANRVGTAVLTNCTAFQNAAGASFSDYEIGFGGAIYNHDDGTVALTNCTLSDNAAANGRGGNLYNGGDAPQGSDDDSTVTLANTIIANRLGVLNCAGDPLADGGHNIDSDGSCGIGPAINPLLDPAGAADNGGLTQTIALQPGSPAIAAGDNAVCDAALVYGLDQRGVGRPGPGSSTCSIGAYEFSPEGCCQYPDTCMLSINRSCGDCQLIDGASCEHGGCTAYTPTPSATPIPTGTFTPTPAPATVTPTPTPTTSLSPTVSPSCTGDCNADGAVTVDEIIRMVNLAQIGDASTICAGAAQWCNGTAVGIDCIIRAVYHALSGCG